jgi:hypothetical protein
MWRSISHSVLWVGLVGLAASPAIAGGPHPRCEAAKLGAAGRYAQCRLAAEAAALKKGGSPDFFKCEAGLAKTWSSSESRTACATSDDLDAVRDALSYETDRFALQLSGDAGRRAGRVLATGQTIAYRADKNDGVRILTPVPDDGSLQAGVVRRFQDNGDGTISDLVTGLMWEKKCDDGGLHDWNRFLPWDGDGTQETIWDWLDDVNAEGGIGFAGHDDWRIPNITELMTLADYGRSIPSVHPVFHTACRLPCTVTTCSCTASIPAYWSATASPDGLAAHLVSFHTSGLFMGRKRVPGGGGFQVRAVRGGEL